MTRARNSANLASQGNLFVDISNDRTGIGSVVPAQNLHVAGTAGFHADTTFVGDLYNATWDRSANKLVFDENSGIRLGNNNELQIDHRGTSYILNIDSNPLVIGSNTLQLTDASTLNNFIYANTNTVILYQNDVEKLRTKDYGIQITGTIDTDGLIVSGVSTFTGAIDANGDLDVDGHTNLDNVSVAGVSTFTGLIDADGGANVDNVRIIGNSVDTLSGILQLASTGGTCLLYTSPSPRDRQKSRMPSSA